MGPSPLTHRHPVLLTGVPPSDAECIPDCPIWQAEALAERRGEYRLRREIEQMLSRWMIARKDTTTLRSFRRFQQEHPSRWPSR